MTRAITVQGIGRVAIRPNRIRLDLKTENTHMEYDKAIQYADGANEQLCEALLACGFAREALKTTDFGVEAQYRTIAKKDGYVQEFEGFTCIHRYRLEFELDMPRLGAVLSALHHSGAEPEFTIGFTTGDTRAAQAELLRRAAADAQANATVLVQAAGVRLGVLLRVEYTPDQADLHSPTRYAPADRPQVAVALHPLTITPEDIRAQQSARFTCEILS